MLQKKEVIQICSKKTFNTKKEADTYGIELAKKAVDYHEKYGEWPLWCQGGQSKSQN